MEEMNLEKIKKRDMLESLREQIRLKEYRKKLERIQELQENERILKEQEEYQYYGKGGAGGIKRDRFGRVIALKNHFIHSITNFFI